MFEKLKNKKNIQYIVIAIAIISLLIILFLSFDKKPSNSETADLSSLTYEEQIENKLKTVLSDIEGVGKVSVAVTSVDDGEKVILSEKTKVTENGKVTETEKPVLENGKTVILREEKPKIKGVLIVCQGANSISVIQRIQQAVISLLGVNINDIEIIKMK